MDKKKFVLLVEDNPIDFDEFETILLSLDFTPIRLPNNLPVTNYTEAIAILKSNFRIEFAILDINLVGEKTGIDIAEYILRNNIPCKILYTTAYLNDEVADKIAYSGTQYGTIVKIDNQVNLKITLFNLRQILSPTNPLQFKQIEYVFVKGKKINPQIDINRQLNNDTLKFSTRMPSKQSILFVVGGSNTPYGKIPKNRALIITDQIREGILTEQNLSQLINTKTLDARFVQINENTCINIMHYEGEINKYPSKLEISVAGMLFFVTKDFLNSFFAYLNLYKMMPISSK
jgi:CheY-like chemotaxis protein